MCRVQGLGRALRALDALELRNAGFVVHFLLKYEDFRVWWGPVYECRQWKQLSG